jgi:hypothetical protein
MDTNTPPVEEEVVPAKRPYSGLGLKHHGEVGDLTGGTVGGSHDNEGGPGMGIYTTSV